jgi:hypothetical protein
VTTILVAISIAAGVMALLASALGYIAFRQAARIARLNAKLRTTKATAGALSLDLHEAFADLDDLRDENVKLLRQWVTGEAS